MLADQIVQPNAIPNTFTRDASTAPPATTPKRRSKLVASIRKQFAGDYDDLSDDDLQQKWLAKYPQDQDLASQDDPGEPSQLAGEAGAFATRIVPPVAVSALTAPLYATGIGALAATGINAATAAGSEYAAQKEEITQGRRPSISKSQIALQGAIGAIPFGAGIARTLGNVGARVGKSGAVKALAKLLGKETLAEATPRTFTSVAAPAVTEQIGRVVGSAAGHGVTGAALGAPATVASSWVSQADAEQAEDPSLSWFDALQAAAPTREDAAELFKEGGKWGFLLGAGTGGVIEGGKRVFAAKPGRGFARTDLTTPEPLAQAPAGYKPRLPTREALQDKLNVIDNQTELGNFSGLQSQRALRRTMGALVTPEERAGAEKYNLARMLRVKRPLTREQAIAEGWDPEAVPPIEETPKVPTGWAKATPDQRLVLRRRGFIATDLDGMTPDQIRAAAAPEPAPPPIEQPPPAPPRPSSLLPPEERVALRNKGFTLTDIDGMSPEQRAAALAPKPKPVPVAQTGVRRMLRMTDDEAPAITPEEQARAAAKAKFDNRELRLRAEAEEKAARDAAAAQTAAAQEAERRQAWQQDVLARQREEVASKARAQEQWSAAKKSQREADYAAGRTAYTPEQVAALQDRTIPVDVQLVTEAEQREVQRMIDSMPDGPTRRALNQGTIRPNREYADALRVARLRLAGVDNPEAVPEKVPLTRQDLTADGRALTQLTAEELRQIPLDRLTQWMKDARLSLNAREKIRLTLQGPVIPEGASDVVPPGVRPTGRPTGETGPVVEGGNRPGLGPARPEQDSVDALRQNAFAAARKRGFTGTDEDLNLAWRAKVEDAQNYLKELADETGQPVADLDLPTALERVGVKPGSDWYTPETVDFPEVPPPTTVDQLSAGPQPRLPGDVGAVRDQDVPTPKIGEAPFALTPEVPPEPPAKPQTPLMDLLKKPVAGIPQAPARPQTPLQRILMPKAPTVPETPVASQPPSVSAAEGIPAAPWTEPTPLPNGVGDIVAPPDRDFVQVKLTRAFADANPDVKRALQTDGFQYRSKWGAWIKNRPEGITPEQAAADAQNLVTGKVTPEAPTAPAAPTAPSPIPTNVRAFLQRQLGYSADQVNAMSPDEATRIGRERVKAPKAGPAAPAAATVEPLAEPPTTVAPRPTSPLARLLRTEMQKPQPKGVTTEADAFTKTFEGLTDADKKAFVAGQQARYAAAAAPPETKAISERRVQQTADLADTLLNDPTPENIAKASRVVGEFIEERIGKALNSGKTADEWLDAVLKADPDLKPGPFTMGFGLGPAAEMLFDKYPEASRRLLWGLFGAYLGNDTDSENGPINFGALAGFMAGAAGPSAYKYIRNLPAVQRSLTAAANKAEGFLLPGQMPKPASTQIPLRTKTGLPIAQPSKIDPMRGVEPVRTPVDYSKDMGLINRFLPTSLERAVPEFFPQVEQAKAGQADAMQRVWEQAKTRGSNPTDKEIQAIKMRYGGELAKQLRRRAKELAPTQGRRADYYYALAADLLGENTRFEATLARNNIMKPYTARRISNFLTGGTYSVLLNWGVDTAAANLTQPVLALGDVPAKYLGRGFKMLAQDVAEGKGRKGGNWAKTDFLKMDRPTELAAESVILMPAVSANPRVQAAYDWWRKVDPSMFLVGTDNWNRRGVFLGALEYAASRGESADAARTWALQVVRKSQGASGTRMSLVNPSWRGPLVGLIRPFTRYPTLFTEVFADTMRKGGPGAWRLLAGISTLAAVGGVLHTAIGDSIAGGARPMGIDLTKPRKSFEDILSGKSFPVFRGAKDLYAHATGTATHKLASFDSADEFLASDLPWLLPKVGGRYPTKLAQEALHVARGSHAYKTPSGSPETHTGTEALKNLLGFKSTEQAARSKATNEASDAAFAAREQNTVTRTNARSIILRAMDRGDLAAAQQAAKDAGLTSQQVKNILKAGARPRAQKILKGMTPRDRAKFLQRHPDYVSETRPQP